MDSRTAETPASFFAEASEESAVRSECTLPRSPARMASNKAVFDSVVAMNQPLKESLAPGAVLADRFIHECVELRARQGHFVGFVFAGIAGLRQFRATPRRRGDVVAGAGSHQFGHLAGGKELRLASQPGGQSNFGKMRDGFQAEKCGH